MMGVVFAEGAPETCCGWYQSNLCRHVLQWFDAHAQSNPDCLALYSSELSYSMTYGELYISTEQKAKRK